MSVPYSKILQPLNPDVLKSDNKITFKIEQNKPRKSELKWTSDIKEAINIPMDGLGLLAKEKPLTMHTLLSKAAQKAPNHAAMKYKFAHKEKYQKITFSEYYRLSCMVAKSFMQLGLEVKHAVCIVGFNAPPWLLSYVGSIFAGGIASGAFTTNNDEVIVYILNNCSCQIAVVENENLLLQYLSVSDQIPKLKAIIQYHGSIDSELKKKWKLGLYDWTEFMDLGEKVQDIDLIERINTLIPNECCSLIYTSGTTGNPKGVMMSHDNLIWTSKCLTFHLKFRPTKENFLSYLPLSHVAAQMQDIIVPMTCQSTTWFAMPDALKGTLGDSLREVQPTWFVGVPRVYEKIAEQMREMAMDVSSTKKSIAAWAKKIGLSTNLAIMNKETVPFGYTLAKIAVFNKVRARLGLSRCVGLFSAAAPMSNELLMYFASLDLIVCEIYGMSETSGPHSVEFHNDFRFGTVGRPLPDFVNKIDLKNPEDQEGEICMKGRHVFMGYVGAPEKTAEVFDEYHFMHSGDIGKVDKEGFLRITGRIKELIITSGGENIPPVPIENLIKEYMPLISNAMVIGDKKKFLVVLLTLKCEINPETQYPMDNLTAAAKRYCKSIYYDAEYVSQVLSDKNPLVWAAVDEALKKANEHASMKAAHVDKWAFLPCDFSIGGGELGPTMKMKRGFVTHMYSNVIDSLYND